MREPQFLAHVVHQRYAEGAVGTHDDLDIGEPLANAPREIPQIIVGSERRRTRAVTQTHQRDHVGLRAGDRNRQVLVLLVEAVKADQLLPTMCGIVEGVHVERDPRRRHGEGVQKLVAQCVTQSPEISDRDGVLKPRQCRLTGQIDPVRQAVTHQLERRVAAESVVIVLGLVVGQNALDPLKDHRQVRVQHLASACVAQCRRKPRGPSNRLIKLPDRQQPRLARQLRLRNLDFDRSLRREIENKRQHTLNSSPAFLRR